MRDIASVKQQLRQRRSFPTTLWPGLWCKQRRWRKSLDGYPPYAPPHRNAERRLTKKQVAENFAYFLATKAERGAHFWRWFEQHFPNVPGADRLERVVNFVEDYSRVLTPSFLEDESDVFENYRLPWEGPQAWASVIFDIATVVGDSLIERCPGGRWATTWDLSLVPDYKQQLNHPTKIWLLKEWEKAERVYLLRGRPLIVWPDDAERPKTRLHDIGLVLRRRAYDGLWYRYIALSLDRAAPPPRHGPALPGSG